MNTKRMLVAALALLLVGFTLSQARQDTANEKDALKGSWTVVKAEENGKGQEELAKAKFTFKDDKLTLKLVNEKDPVELTFKLAPTKKPKEVDIQPTDSKDPAQGIYEIEGDKLKLCVMDPGAGKRPTDFKANGKGVVLIELTRDK